MEKRFLAFALLVSITCSAQLPMVPLVLRSANVPANPFGFTNIPGLYIELLAYDTTNWISSTNTWLDNSGWTNNFKAVTTAPTYAQTGPNGFYAMDFAGNAGGITLQDISETDSNRPNTYIILATDTCTSSGNTLFDSGNTSIRNLLRLGTTGTAQVYAGQGATLPDFANSGSFTLISCVINDANTAVRTNGVLMKTTKTVAGSGQGLMRIGTSQANLIPYTGKYSAVLVWGRALETNELAYAEGLVNSIFGLGLTINSNGFAPGDIWADRVVLNGGAYPSAASKVAVSACLNGMASDATLAQIGALLLYPTDSLIAATTPVINVWTNANDQWVNHNFVGGDLTANGLTGNTTTKYLDTGINASGRLTADSTTLFSYVITTNTASGEDLNAQVVGNAQTIMLSSDLAGTSYSDQYNSTAGQGRQSLTTKGPGYYAGSRTSSTVHNIYFAKNGTAHASIASSATTGGSLPNVIIFAHALNNGGTPLFWSDSTYGAMGVALGLTATQSSNVFNRLVTFRSAMGGTNP